MKVEELMTSPVVVVHKDQTVEHARALMQHEKINALVVVSPSNEIEGILSNSDIATEIDDNTPVEEVMSSRTHVVSPGSGIKDAAKMMVKHNVHHLVAMEDGKIKGMLSSMSFVNLYAQG